ncbi:cache domain-containing protein [Curvivirga aplysinae]|uniref:cache domain-containing protein n=1 Tax=Curvivirga aplysinae TaxID=2529852 RepID=UPI0012BC52FF|nr:cache domain-containing protein [Curvivirga aplysinae]MTI11422.1 hypothetical protein [Curvivirga aplysinae]
MKLNIGLKVLIAASTVVVLAFAVFILYFDSELKQTTTENLKAELLETGRLSTSSISNWMGGRALLVNALAQDVATDPTSQKARILVDNKTLNDMFAFTYFGSAQGEMIMSPNDPLPEGYDPRIRPWYKAASDAKAGVLTEPYQDAATGSLIVTISYPVQDGNKFHGAVGGDIVIDTLSDILAQVNLGGDGYAFLVNEFGDVISHPNAEHVLKPMKEIYPENTPDVSMNVNNVNYDAEQIFLFFKVEGLPTVNWYLGFVVERDKAFASSNEFRLTAVVAGVLSTISCDYCPEPFDKIFSDTPCRFSDRGHEKPSEWELGC